MTLSQFKQILICALLVVLIIGGGNAFWNMRLLLREAKESAIHVRSTTANIDEYVGFQTEQLKSGAYQKYMRNNFAAGSYVQSLVNALNTKTIPLINKNLISSESLISSLNTNTATLNELIANLDNRVSGDGGLLPTTTATIDSIRVLTERELTAAVAELALAGKNVRVITESAELQNLPKEIAQMTASANRSLGSVEVILDSTEATSANVAAITGNLKSISDDSAKKVHSLLNPAPSPWYKKYILTPLKEIGGVTYLLVRIANGL